LFLDGENTLVDIASDDDPHFLPVLMIQHVSDRHQLATFMPRFGVVEIAVHGVRDLGVDFIGNCIGYGIRL